MGSSKNKLCRSSRVESSFDDFFLISLAIAEASSSFSLELFFAAFRFPISFEYLDTFGQTVSLKFKNVSLSTIPNGEFKLNIPEGTDIVSFRNSNK